MQAVDGVSFDIRRGEVFSIVGESGSGKSVTAMTILGLLPTVEVDRGRDPLEGHDLLALREEERRKIRGGEIAMIFQDPLTALNPVHTVGRQIGEMARIHEGLNKKAALDAGGRDARPGRHPRARASGPRCTRTSSPAACASGR